MTNVFFCLICSEKIDKFAPFNQITCSGACRKKKCDLRKRLVLEKYENKTYYKQRKGVTKEESGI